MKLYKVWYSGYIVAKAEDEIDIEKNFDSHYDGSIDDIEEITPDDEEYEFLIDLAEEM